MLIDFFKVKGNNHTGTTGTKCNCHRSVCFSLLSIKPILPSQLICVQQKLTGCQELITIFHYLSHDGMLVFNEDFIASFNHSRLAATINISLPILNKKVKLCDSLYIMHISGDYFHLKLFVLFPNVFLPYSLFFLSFHSIASLKKQHRLSICIT